MNQQPKLDDYITLTRLNGDRVRFRRASIEDLRYCGGGAIFRYAGMPTIVAEPPSAIAAPDEWVIEAAERLDISVDEAGRILAGVVMAAGADARGY